MFIRIMKTAGRFGKIDAALMGLVFGVVRGGQAAEVPHSPSPVNLATYAKPPLILSINWRDPAWPTLGKRQKT